MCGLRRGGKTGTVAGMFGMWCKKRRSAVVPHPDVVVRYSSDE